MIKRALYAGFLVLMLSFGAHAQGVRRDGLAVAQIGAYFRPIPHATVRVCTMPTAGQPCNTPASLFNDILLTSPAQNPIRVPANGAYFYYATQGLYEEEVAGSGVLTQQYPNIGLTGPFGVVVGGVSGDIQTNNGTGGLAGGTQLTSVGGFGALSTYSACYARPGGSDSNGGSSPLFAKLTVQGCLYALPNGSASLNLAGSGTIYVANNTLAHPTANCGIQLMGQNDPNYGAPPTCWIKIPNSGPFSLDFEGFQNQAFGPNPHNGSAQILAGAQAHGSPGLWISGTGGPIAFHNVGFGLSNPSSVGIYRPIVIGECSDGTRTGTCNTSNINLGNMQGATDNTHMASGPCLDITGASFWIFSFEGFHCNNNQLGEPSNNGYGVLIDGTNNAGVGLVYLNFCNLSRAAIRLIPGSGVGGFGSNGCTIEGDFVTTQSTPVIDIAPPYLGGHRHIDVSIQNLQLADFLGNPAGLNVDPSYSSSDILLDTPGAFYNGTSAVGPMTMGVYASGPTKRQPGFSGAGFNEMPKFYAQHDSAAWGFPPVTPRYLNQITGNFFENMSLCGSCTQALATGPAGQVNGALHLTSSSSSAGQTAYLAYFHAQTFSVGDVIALKSWMKYPNGPAGNAPPTIIVSSGGGNPVCTSPSTTVNPSIEATLESNTGWTLGYTYCIITTGGAGFLGAYAQVDNTHEVYLYEFTMIYIPTGSDIDDINRYIMYMQTQPAAAPVGITSAHTGSGMGSGIAANTDINGTLTMSGGTNSYTFNGTYVSHPVCVASDETAIAAVKVTYTAATSVTFTTSGASDVIDYICSSRN